MADLPPFIFSLLNGALLAGMIVFIMVRRPRQLITWAFAGVMAGLAIFFLADVAQYQPGMSARGRWMLQFVLNQGATVAIYAALALNFLLRDKRLTRWETIVVGLIVVRMVIDTIWLAGQHLPNTPYGCLGPAGFATSPCLYDTPLAVGTGALTGVLVIGLFIITTFKAAEPKRAILRRYVLWIALLILGSSVIWQIAVLAGLAGQDGSSVLPIAPATLFAIILMVRLFLALEEVETGVRFPTLGWRIFLWVAALLVAVFVDLTWDVLSAPVWTLVVVAVGIAAGGASLVTVLTRQDETAQAAVEPLPPTHAVVDAPTPQALPPQEPLRLYLLGPMRVVRNGEALPNTSEVWRSTKTRSLLAFLALRRVAGATQVEIVDALWPVRSDLDGKAERSSLSALRSYLSTLRRVLDPDGPRGSDRWLIHEGERYYLRGDGLWVDVWQFETLADQAETLLKQDQPEAGLSCWRQAVALYAPEGLLPDESHLPAPFVEPLREHLRQRWLSGLRRLARSEEDVDHAAGLWEAIHQAEPMDEEATDWLMQHYRRLRNASGLRIVQQRRRSAETEMGVV